MNTTKTDKSLPSRYDRVFSGILQSIIAGGIIWMATEINKLDERLAAMEERTKSMEDIRPTMNSMQLNEEDLKERLIRVEDNQHKSFTSH